MKVSLNSVLEFNKRYNTTSDVAAIGTDNLIEKIGTQLGGIDEVIQLGDRYQGIVIAKVAECIKHPNADKLSLCKVDDNGIAKDVERDEQGYVQVVCGAPNVREGLFVAWLPPGSTVPESIPTDPFVLEAREIRGKKSSGMLASPKELALGDNHDGILEIDGEPTIGSDFAEVFGLKDDIALNIENKMFTHRPDCFGFMGISRELAGIQGLSFKSPDWYTTSPDFPAAADETLPLSIENELPELVKRFCAIVMTDIKVAPSPVWLQVELAKLGQKSINNIVDYTNFFMLETGQPLHAYDYDKVKALSQGEAKITVRKPKDGEKINLLNGKEITPRPEAIMIASDDHLIGIGGVMGGSETEVDNDTKTIIIEAANFDMYSVRRTSMTHGLFTDAVTRFTKGQSPLQNLAVLNKIVDEISRHAGGKVASPLIDDNHLDEEVKAQSSLYPSVSLSSGFINDRLGLNISAIEMKDLLTNVEFEVELNNDELSIKAPFWRTDIELPEDVVEEIGRLYGYNKLPLELPKRSLTPVKKDAMLTLKARIRDILASAGANELLTYSFVHGDLLKNTDQDSAQAYQIANALSPDLQYYRLSLTPSLLDKVHSNIKEGFDQFALFELGKAHVFRSEDKDAPLELNRLALVFSANEKSAKSFSASAYYMARKYLVYLLSDLKIASSLKFELLNPDKYDESTNNKISYYQIGRAATILVGDSVVGEIGEYKSSVRRALKLPDYSAGFELDLSVLKAHVDGLNGYVALPNFPSVNQDITLKVPVALGFQEVYDFVWNELYELKPSNSTLLLEPANIYQAETDSHTKNITFHLQIANYERTLTDKEVNKMLNGLSEIAKQKINGTRI
jgi:phenylalanyl-tRNA synthetase beta chain